MTGLPPLNGAYVTHTLMIQTNSHSPTNYVYTTCWCPLVHLGASETSSHTIQPPSAKPQLTPTNHPPNTMLSHTKHCAGRLFPQHSQASHTQCSTPCYDAVVHRIAFTPPNSSTTQLRGRVCPVSKACPYAVHGVTPQAMQVLHAGAYQPHAFNTTDTNMP